MGVLEGLSRFIYFFYNISPSSKKNIYTKRLLSYHTEEGNHSSETHFQEAISNFKTRLKARGYPKNLIDGTLSEVKFSRRQSALRKQTKKTHEGTIPFVRTYHPAVKNLKELLMQE